MLDYYSYSLYFLPSFSKANTVVDLLELKINNASSVSDKNLL